MEEPRYRKWHGKYVVKIMLWNIIESKENPYTKLLNRQKICLVDDETVEKYVLHPHKKHRSWLGNWYYVDADIIPNGTVRILETLNYRNGMTDYVYDPMWLPAVTEL